MLDSSNKTDLKWPLRLYVASLWFTPISVSCDRGLWSCFPFLRPLGHIWGWLDPGRATGNEVVPQERATRPGKNIEDMENDPVEIVDFPSYNMVISHSYVNVYLASIF